jgi:hypothetical protein
VTPSRGLVDRLSERLDIKKGGWKRSLPPPFLRPEMPTLDARKLLYSVSP